MADYALLALTGCKRPVRAPSLTAFATIAGDDRGDGRVLERVAEGVVQRRQHAPFDARQQEAVQADGGVDGLVAEALLDG